MTSFIILLWLMPDDFTCPECGRLGTGSEVFCMFRVSRFANFHPPCVIFRHMGKSNIHYNFFSIDTCGINIRS